MPAKSYDVKKLEGGSADYRIRLGDIRIIYTVKWDLQQIEILKIEWRGNAY